MCLVSNQKVALEEADRLSSLLIINSGFVSAVKTRNLQLRKMRIVIIILEKCENVN